MQATTQPTILRMDMESKEAYLGVIKREDEGKFSITRKVFTLVKGPNEEWGVPPGEEYLFTGNGERLGTLAVQDLRQLLGGA